MTALQGLSATEGAVRLMALLTGLVESRPDDQERTGNPYRHFHERIAS